MDLQSRAQVHLLNGAPSPFPSLLFTHFISNKNTSALKLRDMYPSTTTAYALLQNQRVQQYRNSCEH